MKYYQASPKTIKGSKFASTRHQLLLERVHVRVAIQRVDGEAVDATSALEFGNLRYGLAFSEIPAVVFHVMAFHIEPFAFRGVNLFRSSVELQAHRLGATAALGIAEGVWKEEGPQEVECDLTVLQQGVEALRNRSIIDINVIVQRSQVLDPGLVLGFFRQRLLLLQDRLDIFVIVE